jgi:hypothetical protein
MTQTPSTLISLRAFVEECIADANIIRSTYTDGMNSNAQDNALGAATARGELRDTAVRSGFLGTNLPNAAIGATVEPNNVSASWNDASKSLAEIASSRFYVEDILSSVDAHLAQASQAFRQLVETATRLANHRLSDLFELPANSYTTQRYKRWAAEHGAQFTVPQLIIFDATAREATKLLSTRNRRKITRKLPSIYIIAVLGSKLLILLFWLLLLLWQLLDSSLLDTPKVRRDKLRRFTKCLSPPPDQPLTKIPSVKPNAPNALA